MLHLYILGVVVVVFGAHLLLTVANLPDIFHLYYIIDSRGANENGNTSKNNRRKNRIFPEKETRNVQAPIRIESSRRGAIEPETELSSGAETNKIIRNLTRKKEKKDIKRRNLDKGYSRVYMVSI